MLRRVRHHVASVVFRVGCKVEVVAHAAECLATKCLSYTDARRAARSLSNALPSPSFPASRLRQVALALIYGPIFPLSYLITSLALFHSYLCTRAGIRYWYRRPAGVDHSMMMGMRSIIGLLLLLSSVVAACAASASVDNSHR